MLLRAPAHRGASEVQRALAVPPPSPAEDRRDSAPGPRRPSLSGFPASHEVVHGSRLAVEQEVSAFRSIDDISGRVGERISLIEGVY